MSNAPKKVVLKKDPDFPQPDEQLMEFRLTYQGPLRSAQRDPEKGQRDPRADHKHEIRKIFHNQLKRLWDITPALKAGGPTGPDVITGSNHLSILYDAPSLALKHAQFGFNFVPLVTQEIGLICGLDILFLRPDKPGKLWAGDIDNRIKTLLDALAVPLPSDNYHLRKPEADEQPFYCLLEKDELITKLSIETDQLLEFVTTDKLDDTRLVITVRLRPYELHVGNMHLG
jgi:hypothetical protein